MLSQESREFDVTLSATSSGTRRVWLTFLGAILFISFPLESTAITCNKRNVSMDSVYYCELLPLAPSRAKSQ